MTGLENMIWENRTKDFSEVRQYLENKKEKDLVVIADRVLNSIEVLQKLYNSDKSYYQFIKELDNDLRIIGKWLREEKWGWDEKGKMKDENENSFLSQHPYIGTMFNNFFKRLRETLESEKQENKLNKI